MIRVIVCYVGALGGGVLAMSGLIDYSAQIWLAVAPVDMRCGLDGLSAIVQQSLGHVPCAVLAYYLSQPGWQSLAVVAVGW